MAQGKLKARRIVAQLRKDYPDAWCTLDHRSPFELLIATILAAQCTDERVNQVTHDLFRKYGKAADYLAVPPEELMDDIRSTGFFQNKTRSIQGCCRELVERHGGEVPETLEELVELPGVGRKTANVILGTAFDTPGIVVDTHVTRLTNRLGLTANRDAVKIEFDLMEIVPRKDWVFLGHALIAHGRAVCKARSPRCDGCRLLPHCEHPQGSSLTK